MRLFPFLMPYYICLSYVSWKGEFGYTHRSKVSDSFIQRFLQHCTHLGLYSVLGLHLEQAFLVLLFFLCSPMMPEPESRSSMEKQLPNFNIKYVTQNRAAAFKRVGFSFWHHIQGKEGLGWARVWDLWRQWVCVKCVVRGIDTCGGTGTHEKAVERAWVVKKVLRNHCDGALDE